MLNLKEQIEEMGYEMTTSDDEAIYVLPDGDMIGGEFDMGYRGLDHNMIAFAVPYKRSDDYEKFWKYVHLDLRLLRVVPETRVALAYIGQELTKEQLDYIYRNEMQLERY